ncbi:MAG: TPM domain-containing protein [Oscillospiraceae bacterium]|nr:TPM domain-containing protein [Oscillospiraceae bacterium]
MKRFLRLLPLLLIAALTLSSFCLADEESPYRTNIWRVNDFADLLTEAQVSDLDDKIVEKIERYQFDLPICLGSGYGEDTLEEFSEWFYPHNEFGYGEDKEGLLLAVDTTKKEAVVTAFGPICRLLYPEADCGRIAGDFMASYLVDGCADAIETYLTSVDAYLAADFETDGVPEAARPETEPMPYWYPADVESFEDFHTAADTPRVVDNADIFTDEEEDALAAKLAELRDKHSADFVLFTDTSSHSLTRGIYSADFYVFNGYGVGDDYNGMILYICMEPGNRGWWEAGTGACERLFTEENVNALDDRLEPYMLDGEYAEGVMNFFSNLDGLFTNGRMPISSGSMLLRVLIAGVISLIVILIVRGAVRKKMIVVRQGAEADEYLARDTFKLRSSHDYFLRTVTTREKIERSSGGGSSYSGGYSSSSGRSFSGGGRSF